MPVEGKGRAGAQLKVGAAVTVKAAVFVPLSAPEVTVTSLAGVVLAAGSTVTLAVNRAALTKAVEFTVTPAPKVDVEGLVKFEPSIVMSWLVAP